jgi:hypothetical protein
MRINQLLKINLYDFILFLKPFQGIKIEHGLSFKFGLGKTIWFLGFNVLTFKWLFLITFPTWIKWMNLMMVTSMLDIFNSN